MIAPSAKVQAVPGNTVDSTDTKSVPVPVPVPGTVTASLANRFQPRKLSHMLGDPRTLSILREYLRSGTLPRAIFVDGPMGSGKTTLNTILAQSITCLHPTPEGDPCFHCASCDGFKQVPLINHPDVYTWNGVVDSGVDCSRAVIMKAKAYPMVGRVRVIFLDEAQGLSKSAEQAILELVRVPPAKTVFLLSSMEPERVSGALKGRCISFSQKLPTDAQLAKYLMSVAAFVKTPVAKDVALAVAQFAQNQPRAALSILDSVLTAIRAGQGAELLADPLNAVSSLVKASPFSLGKKALTALYSDDPATFIRTISGVDNVVYLVRTMLTQNADIIRARYALDTIQNTYSARTAQDLSALLLQKKVPLTRIAALSSGLEDVLQKIAGYQVDGVTALVNFAISLAG